MSVIEDTRKVVQDFLAPELRAISVRLDTLEKRIDGVDKRLDGVGKSFDGVSGRFDGVAKSFDSVARKFELVEQRAERRHTEVLLAIAKMSEITDLRERLARPEAKDRPHQ